ncbi:MAG: Amino acid ABC transporter substrate-binding protein [Oscillospiraceae bacterium]|jgi:polar amino acid transport system substrate-binding protein
MKKILSLLMTALLAISFAGCTSSTSSEQSSSAAASSETQEDTSWSKVQSAGKLVLGLDKAFPPMGYVDTETGEIVGFDIDLAKEACERLGIELELQPIDWDNKSAELNNGNVDCLWNGFSKTPEREEEFALSIPYMKNNQIILVKSGSNYKGLDDLKGKTVGVQADSSAETALNDNPDFTNSLGNVVKIDDYSKAVLEIQNGTIDAIAIDEIVARYYLTKNPDAYTILTDEDGNDASLATEDYVVAFRKSDIALKEKIEGALEEMAKDGTMAEISQKWFNSDITTVGK